MASYLKKVHPKLFDGTHLSGRFLCDVLPSSRNKKAFVDPHLDDAQRRFWETAVKWEEFGGNEDSRFGPDQAVELCESLEECLNLLDSVNLSNLRSKCLMEMVRVFDVDTCPVASSGKWSDLSPVRKKGIVEWCYKYCTTSLPKSNSFPSTRWLCRILVTLLKRESPDDDIPGDGNDDDNNLFPDTTGMYEDIDGMNDGGIAFGENRTDSDDDDGSDDDDEADSYDVRGNGLFDRGDDKLQRSLYHAAFVTFMMEEIIEKDVKYTSKGLPLDINADYVKKIVLKAPFAKKWNRYTLCHTHPDINPHP